MIHKMRSSRPGHVQIVFELPSSIWANQIFLTGEFNEWDEHSLPMKQDRDGVWRKSLDLPSGRNYEFRYIIDGQWQIDFHADFFSSNIFVAQNSVINAELPNGTSQSTRQSGKQQLRQRAQELVKHSVSQQMGSSSNGKNWFPLSEVDAPKLQRFRTRPPLYFHYIILLSQPLHFGFILKRFQDRIEYTPNQTDR